MYCGNCGHQMKEGDKFCTNCGFDNKPTEKKEEVKEEIKEEVKEEVVEVKPTNGPTPVPVNNNAPADQTPVIGIIALICAFIFWPAGLILGIIAIVKGKEIKANKTLGIIATVLSGLAFLFVILFVTIIFAAVGDTMDTIDNYNSYVSDVEKMVMGKWTCTHDTSKEKMVITFAEDNDFNATHESDKIEGNYYAYKDYDYENKAEIHLYYYDDDKYTSSDAYFTKTGTNKATLEVDDEPFTCTK